MDAASPFPDGSPASASLPGCRATLASRSGSLREHSLRIVGFDPGLNVTGYGVIECRGGRATLVEAGCIRSRGEGLAARLLTIHAGVSEVLETFGPRAVAIEQLFVHGRFPKTAILMGHARGVICLAAGQAGLEVHDYLPNRVKSMLTGSGHAGKPQMQAAVQRELGLPQLPTPADAADALAVALADYHLRVRPALSAAAACQSRGRKR